MLRSKLASFAALGVVVLVSCADPTDDSTNPEPAPAAGAEVTEAGVLGEVELDEDGEVMRDEADVDTGSPLLGSASRTPNAPPPTAMLGSVPVWAHFANPVAAGGRDATIMNELIRLLDETPAGATVRGNVFSISVTAVLDAYARAKARGVVFKLTHSGHDVVSEGGRKLASILGDGHVFCGKAKTGESNGCVSTAATSIAHIKFMTFSQTKDPQGVLRSKVSWWGSANQTVSSGMKLFNNTLTYYGDEAVFATLNAHSENMWAQRHYPTNDYYDSKTTRGYLHSGPTSTSLYMSPEQETDLWDARLNDIVPGPDCDIRVLHASMRDSRLAIVNRLIALKAGGCKVTIASDDIEPKALAALRAAGIPIRRQAIHDKAIIHRSRMNSGAPEPRYFVLTGSHNLSNGALRHYDELLSRTESRALYDAYSRHFDDVWSVGTPVK